MKRPLCLEVLCLVLSALTGCGGLGTPYTPQLPVCPVRSRREAQNRDGPGVRVHSLFAGKKNLFSVIVTR